MANKLPRCIGAKQHFLKRGRSVHVDDDGTYLPDMGLDGLVDIHYRATHDLTDAVRFGFGGAIGNAENIGKSLPDLLALWNAEVTGMRT